MRHTIEYNGERRTVEAKRTATVNEVVELAFPELGWSYDLRNVVCVGAGRSADKSSRITSLSRAEALRRQPIPGFLR